MLKEDVELYIKKAETMAWLPQMIPRHPFWKQNAQMHNNKVSWTTLFYPPQITGFKK